MWCGLPFATICPSAPKKICASAYETHMQSYIGFEPKYLMALFNDIAN